MLPRLSGRLALAAALAAAAVTCKGDPTAAGVGSATGIQTSLVSINVNVGATATFTAWVVDVRLDRVVAPITFTTCDPTILRVATDTSYHPVPVTSSQGLVTTLKAGTSCVKVSSPGLPDSAVAVHVLAVEPTVATSPNVTVDTLGGVLTDTARLLGGFGTLGGTLIFQLFDSTRALCDSFPRFVDTVAVSGAGPYHTSPGFTADTLGTWHWTAAYSGDVNNKSAISACSESVAIQTGLSVPGGGTGTGGGHGPAPVVLGTAGNYVILAKSAVSNVPTSAITGNIGLSPAAASFITGFALTLDASRVFSTSAQVTGNIYAADYAVPTPANLTTAVGKMQAAYTDAAGRTNPDHTELAAGNIGGLTLPPGLYKWSNTVTIPTNVTLQGGPNDTWIFQIGGGLTVASAAQVILAGGALAANVVWESFGVVDIGTTAHLEGEVLSQTSITLHTGATVNGRLLAQTAVTLAGNTVVEQ
jgi:hypothetical protein